MRVSVACDGQVSDNPKHRTTLNTGGRITMAALWRFLEVKVAGNRVGVAPGTGDFPQGRQLLATDRLHVRAARLERAARGRVDR